MFGRQNTHKEITKVDLNIHPFWLAAVKAAISPPMAFFVPENFSDTMIIIERVTATDIATIINGSTHHKLVEYGVRIDLQLRLQPLKEAAGRKQRAKFALANQKRAKAMKDLGRTDEGGSRGRWKRRATVMFNKLNLEISKARTDRAFKLARAIVVNLKQKKKSHGQGDEGRCQG